MASIRFERYSKRCESKLREIREIFERDSGDIREIFETDSRKI
jgi:hypothetical protein